MTRMALIDLGKYVAAEAVARPLLIIHELQHGYIGFTPDFEIAKPVLQGRQRAVVD